MFDPLIYKLGKLRIIHIKLACYTY